MPETADAPTVPDEDQVLDALRKVVDPEAGVNIVDLGLIVALRRRPDEVGVRMTMTSAACPMAGMIVDDVHAELEAALGPRVAVDVQLVWEPPWTPQRMSAAARERLGWAPED
jgi:metal-sulfur cluster biosynthetic enzyme